MSDKKWVRDTKLLNAWRCPGEDGGLLRVWEADGQWHWGIWYEGEDLAPQSVGPADSMKSAQTRAQSTYRRTTESMQHYVIRKDDYRYRLERVRFEQYKMHKAARAAVIVLRESEGEAYRRNVQEDRAWQARLEAVEKDCIAEWGRQ